MERSAICCPHCGAIESMQSKACHRCGKLLHGKAPHGKPLISEPVSKGESRRRLETWVANPEFPVMVLRTLIGMHFAVVGALALAHGGRLMEVVAPGQAFQDALLQLGALSGTRVIENGEWYRLFTALFAHFGIIHLLFNSMALNAIGPETSRNLGPGRFMVVYLVAGVAGNAVSLWWHGAALFQVGASGAICGLMGSLYMIAVLRGGAYDAVVRRTVVRWIVMTVIFGFLVTGVDNAAHLAGMAAGALLTRLVGIRRSWVG